MNTGIVQQLRYKLQKRVRKVNSSGFQTFHFSLKRFWQFLHNNEVFVGVLEQASKLVAAGKDDAERIVKGEALHGENEDEERRDAGRREETAIGSACATADSWSALCTAQPVGLDCEHFPHFQASWAAKRSRQSRDPLAARRAWGRGCFPVAP